MKQHIEFIHTRHFQERYYRYHAEGVLSLFIDFFWETDFDALWSAYPQGFSDVLFPNTGYTYLLNLGTPFVMQVGEKKFPMKTDGFLPRHEAIECYHQPGNRLFGIKFKTSPILLQKKVNFAEYRTAIFPLSYLIDPGVLSMAKKAAGFAERLVLFQDYFLQLIQSHREDLQPIRMVTEIMADYARNICREIAVEAFARQYKVSTRTLQRYFEMYTGSSTKKILQIIRIRKALELLVQSPELFAPEDFGYYDHSHFYKHLKSFLYKSTLKKIKPHLVLLQNLHKSHGEASA
ncbi:MAG TPA: AraC family transcriptional regulator [Sediminibacterium sp.]|nr:AraC family transcriptional regulator [Sediminibacterium sp.]